MNVIKIGVDSPENVIGEIPVISIIVPALNAGPYITNCITSLINQDLPKNSYEIIIIDNGSTDNTLDILNEYKEKIIIIHEHKKGSYAARNAGIKMSKGRIIAFTDADCVAHINWLGNIYSGFVSKDIGCIVGAIESCAGGTLAEVYSTNIDILSQTNTLNSRFLPYGQTANVAFRREVFDRIGYFDEELISGGDADIAWRMQLYTSYKLIYSPRPIVWHRHRSTIKDLFRQNFRYGFGSICLYIKYKNHMSHSILDWKKSMKVFYVRYFKIPLSTSNKYYLYGPWLSFLCMLAYSIGRIYGLATLKK